MKSKFSIAFILLISLFYSCSDELSISTDAITMTALSSTHSLEITASSNWTAASSDSWLVLSDVSGKGKKSIVLTCKDNYTGATRTAKISIQEGTKSKTVLINQGGGDVLVNEEFMDNTMTWITTNDSVLNTINNSYFDIKSTAKYYSNFIGTKSIISNYTGNYMISTKFKIMSGDAFGLTFGNKDANNFYRVLIFKTGGIAVSQKLNGVYSTVYSTAVTNYRDENSLSLVKSGNQCTIYFNDLNMNKFNFSTPFGSYVGFYILPQTEVMAHYLKINQF